MTSGDCVHRPDHVAQRKFGLSVASKNDSSTAATSRLFRGSSASKSSRKTLPGKDGLLHISEIDWKRLETVEEAGIKEGDEIDVKLLDIDPKTGKFKLSRKVLLPRPERQERPEKKEK